MYLNTQTPRNCDVLVAIAKTSPYLYTLISLFLRNTTQYLFRNVCFLAQNRIFVQAAFTNAAINKLQ